MEGSPPRGPPEHATTGPGRGLLCRGGSHGPRRSWGSLVAHGSQRGRSLSSSQATPLQCLSFSVKKSLAKCGSAASPFPEPRQRKCEGRGRSYATGAWLCVSASGGANGAPLAGIPRLFCRPHSGPAPSTPAGPAGESEAQSSAGGLAKALAGHAEGPRPPPGVGNLLLRVFRRLPHSLPSRPLPPPASGVDTTPTSGLAGSSPRSAAPQGPETPLALLEGFRDPRERGPRAPCPRGASACPGPGWRFLPSSARTYFIRP